jgi:hypothetical protein
MYVCTRTFYYSSDRNENEYLGTSEKKVLDTLDLIMKTRFCRYCNVVGHFC